MVREAITGERRLIAEPGDSWLKKQLTFSNIAVVAGVIYTAGIQTARIDALEKKVTAAETIYVRQDVYNAERLALARALDDLKAELQAQRDERARRGSRP